MQFNPKKIDVTLAPSALHLNTMRHLLKDTKIKLSAQNLCQYGNGAYTGETSAAMLQDMGVKWVTIGHCERRKLFGETDQVVAQKVKQAVDHDLNTVVCIGETLTERVQRKTDFVNSRMLTAIAEEIDDWSRVSIAY